jgi:hypothetical protein
VRQKPTVECRACGRTFSSREGRNVYCGLACQQDGRNEAKRRRRRAATRHTLITLNTEYRMIAERQPSQRTSASRLRGVVSPRLAPPMPAKSDLAEYEQAATELGIKLMPWQKVAARYITGKRGKGWAFREVVVVVARQNGKTTLIVPRILMALKRGESILHTAQNREIARKTFLALTGQMADHDVIDYVRKGNGQEEIRSTTGGRYKLVAPNGGARGETADLVLLDEVREQRDAELMDAILPTITARPNPQIIYLSNAGTESSIVLNDLRRRHDADKRLAYLEWSAEPHRGLDDYDGWAEANPALGYGLTFETLEYFRANRPSASFETEHLCRWVETMMPSLVADAAWAKCAGYVEDPVRPMLGINMDPSARRASAVSAWQQTDGTIGVRVEADVTGDPIDPSRLGPDLKQLALRIGASKVGYAPWTDAELAKHFRNAKAVDGRDFAADCQTFVQLVNAGRLRWQDAEQIGYDLKWTARKMHEAGAFHAVRSREEHPITAVLAAIRAVGLASGPVPSAPRVY